MRHIFTVIQKLRNRIPWPHQWSKNSSSLLYTTKTALKQNNDDFFYCIVWLTNFRFFNVEIEQIKIRSKNSNYSTKKYSSMWKKAKLWSSFCSEIIKHFIVTFFTWFHLYSLLFSWIRFLHPNCKKNIFNIYFRLCFAWDKTRLLNKRREKTIENKWRRSNFFPNSLWRSKNPLKYSIWL